ncbi:MAG: nucleoside hydrolase [Gammaproteobacteria bacterium]|nr:nucleoside hydrolase [Gammaproteobacteria bacterium]MBU1441253.1 nucleoside hydrolase [Gammaproteobacteria bacterium]MBU2287500.1 nucleoside hydrolase [Gammaproteobacteria bacterium]
MGFDDLAAVLTVQHTPGWSIEGLSLVAGNAPLDVVIDNALRAAACFDWRMPIHAGRDGPRIDQLVWMGGSAGAGNVTAAALVAPATMQFRPAHVAAECKGEHTRGMTVVEWRVRTRAAANALVTDVGDPAGVRRVVLDALARAA